MILKWSCSCQTSRCPLRQLKDPFAFNLRFFPGVCSRGGISVARYQTDMPLCPGTSCLGNPQFPLWSRLALWASQEYHRATLIKSSIVPFPALTSYQSTGSPYSGLFYSKKHSCLDELSRESQPDICNLCFMVPMYQYISFPPYLA